MRKRPPFEPLAQRQSRFRFSGFTLPELMIAMAMSFIVLMVLFSSLSTVNGLVNKQAIETDRRIELSRAFDFMSREIQSAIRINHTPTMAVDGGSTTVANVIANAGLGAAQLGAYGTLVLYLEIPFSSQPPAICPAGSDRAGSAPLNTDGDRVVYDIRANQPSWLGPRVISRYGRIPTLDGQIDPCSNPVGSDILVDSITSTDPSPAPNCPAPGSLSGAGGFWACVKGGLVDLYLISKIVKLENRSINSKAFSYASSGGTLVAPALSGTRIAGNQMTLTWNWSGSSSPAYQLYQSVNNGASTLIYQGSNQTFTSNLLGVSGSQNCYTVVATVGTYTSANSNAVCENQ